VLFSFSLAKVLRRARIRLAYFLGDPLFLFCVKFLFKRVHDLLSESNQQRKKAAAAAVVI
jgi:hypothetical protein